MTQKLNLVFIGLSLSSSWGNGHATTFRALLRGLQALGHDCLFLERDVPWYAAHRDLPSPDFCMLSYYADPTELNTLFRQRIERADAVIIGSYVPDGKQVIDTVREMTPSCLCFYDIDTPVTLAKLRRDDEEYIAAKQISYFDIYLSFSGGDVLTLLERDWHAKRAEALYCSVDEGAYTNTGQPFQWDLGYLGTYSPDRQPKLERLLLEPARRLPKMRFVVAGPQYPTNISWPANVERIEHLPPAQHADFYSKQRFTLNITRADMVEAGWSPSVRLFEAAACKTPIITDRWRGLENVLPGKAILIAETGDEVVQMLQVSSSEERTRMAETAYRIVMKSHTGQARATQLVEYIRSFYRGARTAQSSSHPEVSAAGVSP
ncbi:glycosyltransferase [uncultured Agrobacterium sp.]|uniref:CgeB family protein n=1 Tax=uncultured Agrobacterium sp. TaxID=157277 RepID=UPI0025855794|nr:glycosyltransferase [uncultured Agrobacterium sp.]